MTHVFSKWVSIVVVFVLLFGDLAVSPVFAEELATPSAVQASASGEVTSSVSAVLLPQILETTPSGSFFPVGTPSATPDIIQPTITEAPAPAVSASIRYPMQVRPLSKKMYRAIDRVNVEIDNFDAAQSSVTVTGPRGQTNGMRSYQKTTGSVTTFALVPGIAFVPGKYTVRVESQGALVSIEDFYWGVLAINTNKSIFLPGETAHLSLAVLNEKGDVVCNAEAHVVITDPSGTVTTLSTNAGTITATSSCGTKEMTVDPDYFASYPTTTVGTYHMDLTATTPNGTYSVNDTFEVRDFVPFDVERISATRIYPPNFYPVTMKVKANTDFVGTIEETVPASFTLRQGEGVTPYSAVTIDSPPLDPTAYFVHLQYPFTGKYPVELGFGEALTDPLLQEQYKTYGLVGHDGTDFGLPEGTPVQAADKGIVILAGNGVYGTTIVVQHSWGRSYYGHLSSVGVQAGDKVEAGGELGKSGHTGLTTGPHLHFGIKLKNADMQNGYYGKTDPIPFLSGNATVSDASVKHIAWHIAVKTGQEFTLGYQFQAPNVSPQFYLAGPLTIRRDGSAPHRQIPEASGSANPFVLGVATPSGTLDLTPLVATPSAGIFVGTSPLFSEIRQWQIAADATLPTLIPGGGTTPNSGDADTATSINIENEGASTCDTVDCYTSIDETIANTDGGTTYLDNVNNNTITRVQGFELTDMPTDFSSMSTVTIDVSVQRTGTRSNDNIVLKAQIFQDGGSTAITNLVTICTWDGTTNDCGATWNTITKSFSITGTNTKAVWDSAELHLTWATTKSQSADGTKVQVSTAEVDGTYTATGPTTDQQMRHGKWFSSGSEQSFTF